MLCDEKHGLAAPIRTRCGIYVCSAVSAADAVSAESAPIIYAAIVDDDMDGDGVITVKIARLAKKAGYTERLIGHVIGLLIDADLPEPEPDRTGRANIFRLMTRIIPLKRNAITKSPQNGG